MVSKDKTSITFHSGILTIGGTVIEVAYKDSHIFFDFGTEFLPELELPDESVQTLTDHKVIPHLKNMYDARIPYKYEGDEDKDYANTAVFISHAHLDHTRMLNYLDPSIPLYTLEGTKSLLNTLNINDDFLFPLHNKKDSNTREIIGVKENEVIEVGKIKVKVMPVDHDAYGACGLLIKTPDLVISYTGDIRLHGYREEDTLKFCKESENCDVLLIEGVTVSFKDFDDEQNENDLCNENDLIKRVNDIVNNNPNKQITFNYYISNIERILNIIKTNPRKVVLDAYYSYVLKEATNYESYYYRLDDKDYGLNPEYEIKFEELLNDESEYMWQLDKNSLKQFNKLKKGGIYIHSNAVPLGPYDPSYEPFVNKFKKHNIEFITVSCSGHAHPKDLIKIINLIKPKLLVPIHSYKPEKLYNEHGERLLPKKNQTI